MNATSTACPRTESRRWVHFINDDFFDNPDLDPGLERLALHFERFARDRPWFLSSNQELMDELGCSKNTLAALLRRGEALGWFRRVLITARNGHATGRLAIVLFFRPTSRPVATTETFEQIADQITASSRRPKAPPQTLPFTPVPTQKLGAAAPKNWGPSVPKNWGPPSYKEKDTKKETQKTTMTTLAPSAEAAISIHALSESSSSLASLPSDQEPERAQPPAARPSAPIPAPEIPATDALTQPAVETVAPVMSLPSQASRGERAIVPCTPVTVPSPPPAVHPSVDAIEVTPTVPARVLGLPTEGIDQALLTALVARVVRLSSGFKVGATWTTQQARDAILGLLRAFGCPLWWISNALDQAERRPRAKRDNKPVESWGFIRQTVLHWTQGDGTPGSPPVSKPASPPVPPCPGVVSGDRTPGRSPPGPADIALDADLSELSAEDLRQSIAELKASLSQFESTPRTRMGEFLRTKLSQAQSELTAREVRS